LINYSNPMTAICRAVQKYTSIKIIGLCHGLQNTVRRIAPRIGYQAEDVQAWAAGVNHFIWLTSLLDRSGRDLYPVLKRHARENWEVQPLAYDLLELYGLFVSGGDDHIVEFMPEYASPDCVEKYMLDMDYVQKAVDHQQQEIAELRRLASDENKRVSDFITGSAESAAEIIDCLTNKKTELFMANVRNEGKIPGLPYDAVVEVPCVTTPSGLKGIMVDPLPSGVLGRIQTCLSEYELVVDAAVLKDRKLAVQAMLVCSATTSRERAEGVVDAMLAANKQYIGDFR
jgi:alpha-galactosidase